VNTFPGVSLLELLRFYADKYLHLTKNLADLEQMLQAREEPGRFPRPVPDAAKLCLEIARDKCNEIGLQVSVKHANELLLDYAAGLLKAHDVEALNETIRREISCQFFVGIAAERKTAFCESRKGWEVIVTAFPAATDDVEEMNKCFGLCRYPAAVFHSLMVVEHGLVALGAQIDVTDPKRGWDATCKKLDEIMRGGHNQNTTKLPFAFLEQVNVCIQSMKFAWRNKVSHAAGKLTVLESKIAPDVAQDIISATHNFMNRLQEGGIKESDWIEQL